MANTTTAVRLYAELLCTLSIWHGCNIKYLLFINWGGESPFPRPTPDMVYEKYKNYRLENRSL